MRNKLKKIININNIIFILFIFFTLIIGSHHEPWTDEAQSWIIARDASVQEILFNISSYEGTFPLWILTLKLFITFGLKYEFLFIVPIIISSIGLWVFLHKVEMPTYIKILFPFTFYVFYQYTIISRSYCFLLLAFSLCITCYKTRDIHVLKYILCLIFFSFISMHGIIISVVLGSLFFIEMFKRKEIKNNLKYFLILGFVWIFEIIILFPKSDLYILVNASFNYFQIIKDIITGTFNIGNNICKIYNLITVLLFSFLILNILFLKNKTVAITTLAVFLFMFVIRFSSHHYGILFLLIMFGIISNYAEIKKKNKFNEKIIFMVLILYSVYSVISGVNDYFYDYSGSKQMAEYIKTMGYEKEEIYGFGFKDVSLEPYFDKIYKNWPDTIYRWSVNNIDFYNYCNFIEIDKSQFIETPKFILIQSNKYSKDTVKLNYITAYIEKTGKYEIEYETEGNVFFKNSYSETEGFTLYRLKE